VASSNNEIEAASLSRMASKKVCGDILRVYCTKNRRHSKPLPSTVIPSREDGEESPATCHRRTLRGTFRTVRTAYNFYVYILSNKWRNVLYTGVTNDLQKRLWQHRNGAGRGFAKRYNCDQLVYFEWYDDIRQAIARETQIKGWSRSKKDVLIASTNPELRDLSGEWNGPE